MPPKKRTPAQPGQLSFARELFSAKLPDQEVVGADMSGSEPTAAILPSTPNSFGYALHILQDPTIFKRALVWKVVGWLLGGGGVCYLGKALIDAF